MTGDQYVQSVLTKYAVDTASAKSAAESIAPALRTWAGEQLSSLEYSGSFAKGTATRLSADVDLFISLKSSTQETLRQIFESLYGLASNQAWSPVRQNVSIRVSWKGKAIDLVPGKIQAGYQNVHSLYKRKSDSWTQTNVSSHIAKVSGSGRTQEIQALKIWRDLHGLSFPSFYLELLLIEGLKYRTLGDLSGNVLHGLGYIAENIGSKRIVDPANTNNIVSDDLSSSEKSAVARQAGISASKQYWKEIIW